MKFKYTVKDSGWNILFYIESVNDLFQEEVTRPLDRVANSNPDSHNL